MRSMQRIFGILVCLASIVLAGACSAQSTTTVYVGNQGQGGPGQGGPPAQATTTTGSSAGATFTSSSSPIPSNSALAALNLTALPVGDNSTTTSGPTANHIYVCTTSTFGRGGAANDGPWFN